MVVLQNDSLEYNQCQEAVKRLTDFLSDELRPDEEDKVKSHLAECRGCLAKFEFEETLLRTIRERAVTVCAPEHLRSRILNLLPPDGSSASSLLTPDETGNAR